MLETKGDGIISLVTIGLIRQSTRISSQGKSLILAIEEPESHLHPQAMHQLNDVIKEISNDHQVIITTHNQAFVERNNIEANIIIQNQRPHVAQNTGEIRDSLGVRIGDNLVNCEVVLIVEGPEDEKVLKHFICAKSSKLKSAFGDNRININILHGAGGLSYKIDEVNRSLCRWHCFLDSDYAGNESYKKAVSNGMLKPKQVTFTSSKGTPTELEDWFLMDVYRDYIENAYGKILESEHFTKHKGNWSSRLETAFIKTGKLWDDNIESTIKNDIADLSIKHPDPIKNKCKPILDSLVLCLEKLLDGEN